MNKCKNGECEAEIAVSHMVNPKLGLELCKDGHLMVFDPRVRDGKIMIWRLK